MTCRHIQAKVNGSSLLNCLANYRQTHSVRGTLQHALAEYIKLNWHFLKYTINENPKEWLLGRQEEVRGTGRLITQSEQNITTWGRSLYHAILHQYLQERRANEGLFLVDWCCTEDIARAQVKRNVLDHVSQELKIIDVADEVKAIYL